MMNKTGKLIQELRTQAGFTQKTLADALHITDKAVSKWERGICLPDVTLLPKLSLLLDTDVETLISKSIGQEEWVGLIDIHGCDLSRKVYDKPLVYYLLSHFLLLGIRRIHVITEEENQHYLASRVFKTLGFQFSFTLPEDNPVMILNHPWFLFGSDLTQQFQGAMLSGRDTVLVPQNQEAVFCFTANPEQYFSDPNKLYRSSSVRTLGRGMVCLDMGGNDKILDVASFVKTYQQNARLLIASLEEIAYRNGYISEQELLELAQKTTYAIQLLALTKPEVD